jgi:hypothetical protein
MTTLRQLLADTSRQLLVVIARQRRVPFPRDAPKGALVDLLAHALADPAQLYAALDGLSDAERAVLDDLLVAGGRLPRSHLARRHGDFHPYRPWQPEAPSQPWESPTSPTDHLYFLGLIFWERATNDLVVPADLVPLFPAPAYPPPPTPATGPLEAALAAAHDLALLLALLEAGDVPPRHGRWLTPRLLATWGGRSAVPPAHAEAQGEHQTGRRRFLHYLAEAAGLAALAGPFLKPTPAGWAWLRADPPARLRTLWETLAAPATGLWQAYRLPGHRHLHDPAALVEATLRALPHHDPADPGAFAAALLARDPALYYSLHSRPLNAEELLAEAIIDLLTGPLIWLGALARDEAGVLSLTGWGAAWLGLAEPSVVRPPAPFTLGAEFTFTPPGEWPDPLALATLETCAERLADGRYQVTPVSFVHALHRGHALPDLLDRLERLADRSFTGQERATLAGWAENAERAVIRRLTVLEAADPQVIARLSQARRGRGLLRRTLSRRAVVVDEGRLPLLVRRLTEQEGVPPRVEAPPPAAPADPALGRGGAAHLWLAARVYQRLGRFIRLPARFPQELLEHLAALAEPGDLMAADAAAAQVLVALQDVLDGRAAFPAWVEPGLPVEETLALVQEALEEGSALEMAYYTAGREELTHRVVEPLRLETRGGVAYLVGFCHRAQAERVFRLDRIYAVVKVPIGDWRLEVGG